MKDKAKLRLALNLSRLYEVEYHEYLAECAAYRRRGYRAHHCEHGTNMWTDYDAICGGCENGDTMADPMQRRLRALIEATARMDVAKELFGLPALARRLGVEHAIDPYALRDRMSQLLTV